MSIEVLEDEVSETFTLTQPPTRIEPTALPRSPKSTYLSALNIGWDARAWLSTGEVAPVLYVSNSEENAKSPHNAGDIKFRGYTARMFVVEARDLAMPLGFRAHYLGKEYSDGSKATAGSFGFARVVDPAGVASEARAVYKPIPQLRGKYETAASFQRRSDEAKNIADGMTANYNDNTITIHHTSSFSVARDFDSWLAGWQSFTGAKK